MMLLYKHYLKKPAYLVDQMLGNVFLLKWLEFMKKLVILFLFCKWQSSISFKNK
jgi:hypothetical protein